MRPELKNIRDITDSKELYESKPHPFLSIFIYILLVLLIAAGVWMYFGEIDIVSKGTGVVRPNEKVSRITNKVQGEVVQNTMQEGAYVQKGELLFEVGYKDLSIQLEEAEELLQETKDKLILLEKLRDSILQGKNLFDPEIEKEYYDRYVKYQQDYQSLRNSRSVENKNEAINVEQTQITQQMYQDKIEDYDDSIKELTAYQLSVAEGVNKFENKQSVLSLAFDTYLYQVYELEDVIADKRRTYDLNTLLDEEDMIAKKEVEDSKVALQQAENELQKLTLQTQGQIEDQLEEVEKAKELATREQAKLIIDNNLLAANDAQRMLTVEKFETDTLVNLYDQIDIQETNCRAREQEVERLLLAIDDCKIVAPISGTLHITQVINEGDLIGAGVDIGTIIPEQDNLYKVEIFMANRDIAGIEEGDIIHYKFDALPYKEYGQLEGQISNISADARVNDTYGTSGYVVEGTITNETVYSYKGEPASIKVGMTCEAHVVTEQKKILYYLLEKINLMD